MENDYRNEFECMGQYFDAKNIGDFRSALSNAIYQTLDKTTVSVELLDENRKPTVSNINVTFINDFTNEPVYEFVHYLDPAGRPDSVEIDAVLSYQIRVNTVPPVYQMNPKILAGKHNVIRIQCPQGILQVSQKDHSEYKKDVEVLIYEKDDPRILHTIDINEEHEFLSGYYDIEITTIPRIRYSNVYIKPGEKVKIDVPPPGVLNVNRDFPGFGSIYLIENDGSESWVHTLDSKALVNSIALQPGKYKLVFRAGTSKGSKFTKVEIFEIRSGKTVSLKL
jgi:Ca-activated chloride channel family protein